MSRNSFSGISSRDIVIQEEAWTRWEASGHCRLEQGFLWNPAEASCPEESLCGLAVRWLPSSPFCSEIHQRNLMVGNTKIRHNVIYFFFLSPMLIYIQILLSIQGWSEGLFPHEDIKSRVWVGSLYVLYTQCSFHRAEFLGACSFYSPSHPLLSAFEMDQEIFSQYQPKLYGCSLARIEPFLKGVYVYNGKNNVF